MSVSDPEKGLDDWARFVLSSAGATSDTSWTTRYELPLGRRDRQRIAKCDAAVLSCRVAAMRCEAAKLDERELTRVEGESKCKFASGGVTCSTFIAYPPKAVRCNLPTYAAAASSQQPAGARESCQGRRCPDISLLLDALR